MLASLFRGFMGSIIGGAIGAFIWVTFSYGTGYELGFIAWAVGALAGYGMARGSDCCGSQAAGALAAIVAFTAIPCAKLAVVHLNTRELLADAAVYTEDDVLSDFAYDDVMARYDAGELTDEDLENYWELGPDDDMLAAAQQRWDSMSASQQKQHLEEKSAAAREDVKSATFALNLIGFLFSFGAFDLLWFGLALTSAYRLGSADNSSPSPDQVHHVDLNGHVSLAPDAQPQTAPPPGGSFFANLGRSEMAAEQKAAAPPPARQAPPTAPTQDDNSCFARLGQHATDAHDDRRAA